MRTVTSWTHFAQFALQWGFAPRPEWFDHYLDQHWQWSATNNGLWVERGVFSYLVLKDKSRMLEICSGDGFNTKHFYSIKCQSIAALDFDETAVSHTRRYNSAPNITYITLGKISATGSPPAGSIISSGMPQSSILLRKRSM
jgi:hypothetical protein